MLFKNIKACFLLIIVVSTTTYAQLITESIRLNWEDQPRQQKILGKHQLHYLYFEDASYTGENPQFPIYSKQIELTSYGDLDARLVNEQYLPLTNTTNLDLTTIDNIELTTAVNFARRKPIGIVSFIPIRKNPTTGQYEKLIAADLQIQVIPKASPYSNNHTARNFATTSNLSDGKLYKIAITNTGVQKLDYDFLKSIGIDIDNIDPKKIQILGNGGRALPEKITTAIVDDVVENHIFVVGENDGRFDPNDYILFYGVGTQNWDYQTTTSSCMPFSHSTNPYTNESYYFIKVGNNNGLRMLPQNSISSSNYITNSYDALAHHEIDATNLMEEEPALPPSGREWYGESFRITRTRDFNFSFNNRIETEPINIKSNLAVRIFSSGDATLSANGTLVGQPLSLNFTNPEIYAIYAFKFGFPCAPITRTGQDIKLQIKFDHTSTAANMWLDYLSVQARCQLSFNGNQMAFRDARSIGQNGATYQMSNANNVTIWDVTDPYNAKIQSYNGSGNISFNVETSVLHEFVAFNNSQFYSPKDRGTVTNQNLHSMITPPDAVFIVHSSLRTEAERLANHRRNKDNMTIEIVDIADIYNEFASGNPDLTAIRNFCKMLYDRETSTNKFTHLLLFGIGSFDYKSIGDDRSVDNNPNLIPLYQTRESLHPIFTYTSDDYFALLDPNEPMTSFSLLDIAVGRLPAQDADEAKTLVDKIIDYETNPVVLKDWKNRLCFIADDEDTNEHLNASEQVILAAKQGNPAYNIEKIYLDAYKQVSTSGGERYPDAKNSLLDALFKGSLIVNYLGHGGDDGWTQERVFTSSDINRLSNKDKLPLFITATCSFGPHDNPKLVSAAELLLLNPNGGAISVFTTTRVVISADNRTLVKSTFNTIFDKKANGKSFTTGEVLQLAKNKATGADPENTRKYSLLGDPTMTLAYPRYSIQTTTVNGQPVSNQDTLKALELATISGKIVDDNGNKISNFNGTIYPTIFDKKERLYTLANDPGSYKGSFDLRKKIIFKGQASVTNGEFTFSFVVPKDINYTLGYGKLSYYAENGSNLDGHGYSNDVLVGGSNPNPTIDNKGPEVLVYMNTEQFASGGITDNNPKLLVKLYDENGINTVGNSIGHDLTAKLIPSNQIEEEYILNDFYESTKDDYTRGTAIYPLKDLKPGLHTINVKAWDVYNNPGEGSTEFIVAESANMALAHVLNYPNPFTTSTNFQFEHNLPYQPLEIQVQIYTVSGRLVKTINHDISAETNSGYRVDDIHWDGLDDYGDRIGKGVYIYKIFVQAEGTTDTAKQNSEFQKLVILK